MISLEGNEPRTRRACSRRALLLARVTEPRLSGVESSLMWLEQAPSADRGKPQKREAIRTRSLFGGIDSTIHEGTTRTAQKAAIHSEEGNPPPPPPPATQIHHTTIKEGRRRSNSLLRSPSLSLSLSSTMRSVRHSIGFPSLASFSHKAAASPPPFGGGRGNFGNGATRGVRRRGEGGNLALMRCYLRRGRGRDAFSSPCDALVAL